jgi:hypothetical protein
MGLLAGMQWLNTAWQVGAGKPVGSQEKDGLFCVPGYVTRYDEIRVIVNFLQKHPERLNENQVWPAINAFTSTFPCPPKAQSPRR